MSKICARCAYAKLFGQGIKRAMTKIKLGKLKTMKIKKLVIATRNRAKIDHYREIFSDLVGLTIGLDELGIGEKPEEKGKTAEENAQIKARFYASKTDLPVFSEDECLYADFLPQDQQPGVNVRRINGKDEVPDKKLLEYWENVIKDVAEDKRRGCWHFAYCLIHKGKEKTVSQDFPVKFYYPVSKIRIPGWPLSSIQGSQGKPHSEYNPKEKERAKIRDQKLFKQVLMKMF